MSRRGAVAGVLLAVTAGGLAAAGTVWAGGAAAPVPSSPRAVAVADAPSTTVCPGPPVLPGGVDEPGTDPGFDPAPVDVVTSLRAVAAPGAPSLSGAVLAGADVAAAPLPAQGTVLTADGSVPVSVTAAPTAAGPSSLGALHTAATTGGDLRGLAATRCAVPVSQGWLVGGGTSVGRSGRLLLANPGAAPSTVDLTVLTPGGAVEPVAGRDLVLAPGEQRQVLLEGLVGGQDAVAVGFAARGAPVSALLVDTRLRGLTPAGVDIVAASTGPATRQVVPGLEVDGRTALSVRLAVPGDVQAVVRWQLYGPEGPVADGVEDAVATLAPGTVVDVRLPAVGPAAYSLAVEADVPVLAAVALERGQTQAPSADGAGEPVDVAWAASTPPLAGESVVVLPRDGVSARLALSADGSGGPGAVEVVDVAVDGTAGASRRVSVAETTTTLLDLPSIGDGSAEGEGNGDGEGNGGEGEGDGVDGPVAVLVRAVTGTVHAATVLTASSQDAEDDMVAVVGAAPAPVGAPDVLVSTAPPGRWPTDPQSR